MAGAERVVDVHLAQRTELGGESIELGLVLAFLTRLVSHVLQQQHFTGAKSVGQGLSFFAGNVCRSERNGFAEQFAQPIRRGPQREFRIGLTFGSAEMAHQHQLPAGVDNLANRRQGHLNPTIVGHFAVCQGHVEVHSHQYSLAGYVNVFDRPGRHVFILQ